MNCKNFQEQISSYLDNKLSLEEAKDLMKHLESCSDCKQLHNDLIKVKKILSSTPKITVSNNFTDSVMSQIYKIQHKKKDNIVHFSIKKYFAIAASFLFILSASVFFVMQQTKSNINSSVIDSEAIFETYDNQFDYIYENDVTAFLSMY